MADLTKKGLEKDKKKTALERFKELDDLVEEDIKLPETVYSVSYTVSEGPYQSIMVKANSEEEAMRKVVNRIKGAKVLGASIEYNPEDMVKRGKPLLEEIQNDISVREWYTTAFPNDELGYQLKDDINFEGLDEVLQFGKDVYEFLGVEDSIVRERVFDKLADLTGVAYDDIYEKWINTSAEMELEDEE